MSSQPKIATLDVSIQTTPHLHQTHNPPTILQNPPLATQLTVTAFPEHSNRAPPHLLDHPLRSQSPQIPNLREHRAGTRALRSSRRRALLRASQRLSRRHRETGFPPRDPTSAARERARRISGPGPSRPHAARRTVDLSTIRDCAELWVCV